jgi:hypothetical protein
MPLYRLLEETGPIAPIRRLYPRFQLYLGSASFKLPNGVHGRSIFALGYMRDGEKKIPAVRSP